MSKKIELRSDDLFAPVSFGGGGGGGSRQQRRNDFHRNRNARDNSRARDVQQHIAHHMIAGTSVTGSVGTGGVDANISTTALLHKSLEGRGSPLPGRIYPTGSVTGMPRAL